MANKGSEICNSAYSPTNIINYFTITRLMTGNIYKDLKEAGNYII